MAAQKVERVKKVKEVRPSINAIPLYSGVIWLALSTATLSCTSPPETFETCIRALDEQGMPLTHAHALAEERDYLADPKGVICLSELSGPAMTILSAEGSLSEPVAVSWEDADRTVDVRLFARTKNGRRRYSLHFAGDSMFGRRYEEPPEGEALIPVDNIAAGAQHVVSAIAPGFASADASFANLETVVSNATLAEAYPGKRFLLNSRPNTLAAIHDLGVDLIIFANNHTRDWLDAGVAASLQAFAETGLPQVGGGLSNTEAETAAITEVEGIRIGTLSRTSVTGSFVNDNYPSADEPVPADLNPAEAWQYEERLWGFEDSDWSVPTQSRRIGAAWRLYRDAEAGLPEATRAAAWSDLMVVYPELQDWVARRGHGGAAMLSSSKTRADIEALRPQVDLLVIQIHAGFQFLEAASQTLKESARAAIDAGADIVIAHHPHVLQGMEWYKGRLIVYSLGNFVFDQDFLATYPSGFVRTIWEQDKLLEARFIPHEIVDYRPRPTTGEAARRTIGAVWERSVLEGESRRDSYTGKVFPFASERPPESVPAHFIVEHHSARIVAEQPAAEVIVLELAPGQVAPLPDHMLVDARLGLDDDDSPDIWISRDLHGWGRFEDELADSETLYAPHWALNSDDERVELEDAASGRGYLTLRRTFKNNATLTTRLVSRIPLARHRLYEGSETEPMGLDPAPVYSVHALARGEGSPDGSFRLDIYHFDDTDPTRDPASALLDSLVLRIPSMPTRWAPIDLPFDLNSLQDGPLPNQILAYVQLAPATEAPRVSFDLDELTLLEWRQARGMPQSWMRGAFVRNTGDTEVKLEFSVIRRPSPTDTDQ